MTHILHFVTAVGRGIAHSIGYVVSLVRDGQDDLDGTFPDRAGPTGEQAATNAGISASGMGGSAH